MRFLTLEALAISILTTHAFQNTSPFVFFSTSEILASSPQIATAASINDIINRGLGNCPSDIYVIVSQPGVVLSDYSSQHSTPYLRKWASGEDKHIRSSFTVSEVLGEIDTPSLTRTLEQQCGANIMSVDTSTGLFDIANDMKPCVIKVDFSTLPNGSDRSTSFLINDLFLYNLINILPSPNYTVIYTTTPLSSEKQHLVSEPSIYQMDNTMSPLLHIDLKRDLAVHERAASANGTSLPLFEKYQYFTPGIFMGLLVTFILLMMLYVAISGVSSLQVSYAAFDKENGPAAQKKQQQ